MLDLIRNNSQSLGVKLAFGIIILVFVFWGLGSVQSINNSTTLATVNEEAITVIDFEQAYQQARESVRAQNPQVTPEQIKQMQLPQQVMQQLVMNALLREEVKRLQLSISPEVLRKAILAMPAFHNAEGKFDPALYKTLVDARFLGAGNFEKYVEEQMTQEQLREDMTLTAQGFSTETSAFMAYTYEERDIEFVFFPAADYLTGVEAPAEDSVKAYYESHRNAYALPAKADVSYIKVNPIEIGKPASFSAEAVKAYYDAKQSDFSEAKKFKASHILLALAETASEEEVKLATEKMQGILDQIKAGADFAALAKEHSADTGTKDNGGSLDWVREGDTVPAFNDTLMSMKPGQVSDIVRTNFGLHIIKVDDFQEAKVQDLAAVEEQIRTDLAREAGLVKIREVVDALIEANVLGNDLNEAAKAQGLSLMQTGLMTAPELEKELFMPAEQVAKIFTVGAGVPLDTALETSDLSYVIARVAQKEEASVRPFDEVKADIVSILTKDAAQQKAVEAAQAARANYSSAAPSADQVRKVEKAMRGQPLGVLGNAPELGIALFSAPKDAWLENAYPVSVDGAEGAVLARVVRVGTSSADVWKPLENILNTALSTQRAEKMFQLFLYTLYSKAEVKIVNQAYLDSVSAQ